MKIDLDYILNLSDEDLYKLNRQQLIRRLKVANRIAEDRRTSALDYLEKHPDMPTPLVYKNYTKWIRPKHGAIDWKNYDFDFENGESMEVLQHKLVKTRAFLSTKTSTIEGWREVLMETAKKMSENLGIDVEFTDISYKRLWRTVRRLEEKADWGGTRYDNEGRFNSEQARDDIYEYMTRPYLKGYGVDRLFEFAEAIMIQDYQDKAERPYYEHPEEENITQLEQKVYGGLGRQDI